MFNKINKISLILIVIGVLIAFGIKWIFKFPWMEDLGFFVIIIALILNKKTMIQQDPNYGAIQYYTILAIFLGLIFVKWFFL